MSACGGARYTGRTIIKFEGCYHGMPTASWSRRVGSHNFGIPDSAGVPLVGQHTLVAPYNDSGRSGPFERNPSQIAGNRG